MALTGLQIQKLLPKTNCKECGCNTCMAFAMKLASKKAELSECPYASDEAKQVLGAASTPPVVSLALGTAKPVTIGGETVFYRHEKTFAHQTALAINVNDTDAPAEIQKTLETVRDYVQVRVGETLIIDLVAVTQKGNDPVAFAAVVKQAAEVTGRPVIAHSTDLAALKAAAAVLKGTRSLLASATPETAAELLAVAKENDLVLGVTAPDLNALAATTAKLRETEFKEIVLQFQTSSPAEQFQSNSIARRAALKDSVKAMGYPTLFFAEGDLLDQTAQGVNEICKYGGILVLPAFDAAQLTALMTLRLNIYTDPQKPIQVEPKLYPIGEPGPDSPVFVTTNFSLTYFIVSGEIENSGTSAWLLIPECEGMSVLTAWAAGKFSGASIGKFAKEIEMDKQLTSRTIVLPGYVAQISGELEEAMPGWTVLVGPQEAADLESFIKARLN